MPELVDLGHPEVRRNLTRPIQVSSVYSLDRFRLFLSVTCLSSHRRS